MSEVTGSAKDKMKSKTDKDKRSEVRTSADKDKEALEWAIKSPRQRKEGEQRRRPKKRKKWQRPWRNPGWRPKSGEKALNPLLCTGCPNPSPHSW
jgi:hypothetical protein